MSGHLREAEQPRNLRGQPSELLVAGLERLRHPAGDHGALDIQQRGSCPAADALLRVLQRAGERGEHLALRGPLHGDRRTAHGLRDGGDALRLVDSGRGSRRLGAYLLDRIAVQRREPSHRRHGALEREEAHGTEASAVGDPYELEQASDPDRPRELGEWVALGLVRAGLELRDGLGGRRDVFRLQGEPVRDDPRERLERCRLRRRRSTISEQRHQRRDVSSAASRREPHRFGPHIVARIQERPLDGVIGKALSPGDQRPERLPPDADIGIERHSEHAVHLRGGDLVEIGERSPTERAVDRIKGRRRSDGRGDVPGDRVRGRRRRRAFGGRGCEFGERRHRRIRSDSLRSRAFARVRAGLGGRVLVARLLRSSGKRLQAAIPVCLVGLGIVGGGRVGPCLVRRVLRLAVLAPSGRGRPSAPASLRHRRHRSARRGDHPALDLEAEVPFFGSG